MIPALRLVVVSIGLLQAVTAQIQQHSGEEAAKQLIVMIDGTVGGSPTFGAGIIFGHTPQRLYIATADHIVRRGLKAAEEIRLQFRSLPGEEIEARLLRDREKDLDLAVLAVDLSKHSVPVEAIPFDRLGDPDSLQRRDEVYHVGYPNGNAWWVNLKPDLISEPSAIRIRFASEQVKSGNSGGGLFNSSWELVGMVDQDQPPQAEAVAVGRILAQLKRWGYPVALKPAVDLSADLGGGVEIRFVEIPAGEFEMGSNNGDEDEKPVRRVSITLPFQLGQYEVTQAQWQMVMGDNPSRFKGAKRPVEMVSWEHVQRFIDKMNQRRDGFEYRLPTEAEWEYAARAGTAGEYAGALGEMAWYGDNSGDSRIDATQLWKKSSSPSTYYDAIIASHGQTHPVGQKEPNAWRLYDMHGNVAEWVQDWYDEDYYSTRLDPDTDPQGPKTGSFRVIRGGSWVSPVRHCRSADRFWMQDHTYDSLGLRLLRRPR